MWTKNWHIAYSYCSGDHSREVCFLYVSFRVRPQSTVYRKTYGRIRHVTRPIKLGQPHNTHRGSIECSAWKTLLGYTVKEQPVTKGNASAGARALPANQQHMGATCQCNRAARLHTISQEKLPPPALYFWPHSQLVGWGRRTFPLGLSTANVSPSGISNA